MVPEKFQIRWLSPKTPIRNLYLTGSDAAFFGIVGAMMSGVLSMAVAIGRPWKLPAIFARQLIKADAFGTAMAHVLALIKLSTS